MAVDGPPFNIEDNPEELLIEMFSRFHISELVPVRQVSRTFNKAGRNKLLLERVAYQDLHAIIEEWKILQPDASAIEIEEHLNLVWGDSFFETYRLTWQEYARELSCIETSNNPTIQNITANKFPVTPKDFVALNNFLLETNWHTFDMAVTPQAYIYGNGLCIDFKGLGLTRIFIEALKRLSEIGDIDISKLDLSGNYIKNIPDSLWQQNLVKLNLSDNEIEVLSESLQQLGSLQKLDITKNNISSISVGNKPIVRKTSPLQLWEIFASQKNKPEKSYEVERVYIMNQAIPLLMVLEFNAAPESTLTALLQIGSIIQLSLGTAYTCYKFSKLLNLKKDRYEAHRLPLRDRFVGYMSDSSPTQLPAQSNEASAYDIGRKSSKEWIPYFLSFARPVAYSRAYYAGLEDERDHLPSRISSISRTPKPFKESARIKLDL